MKLWEAVGTLLAITVAPLGVLYLYDIFYNYKAQEENEVELDKEEVGDQD